MSTKPTTTVLVTSTGEAHLLRHSLPAAVAQEGAEVVVVDNGRLDDTSDVAHEHGVRVIAFPAKTQYCAVMNAAIQATDGDAVLLLNADCFLEPGFLAAARPRLDEPGVGSVAPKLLRTRGPEPGERLDAIDAAGMVIDRRRKNTLVGHGRPGLAFDQPGEVFGVDGAAALYRRETLAACAVDGEIFDTDFERWASDVDLAWRARLLGWKCFYEPRALAYHVRWYSPSTRAGMPERDRRMQFRNRYLMMAKNDTARGLVRDLPVIAAWEVAALGWALLRERHLLRAYAETARLLPGARRRRRAVQAARRRAGVNQVPFGLVVQP
jgi:GT2 family glycosyltransferase